MFDKPGVHRDYKTLLAAAESGEANAAYELSVKLAACKKVPLELSDYEKTLQRLRPLNPYKTRAREFRRDAPTEALSPSAISKWMERAAILGSTSARTEMVRTAALRARHDVHWTPEKIDAETSEYIRSVEGAALKGNLDALTLMSFLYLYGLLVPTDVVRSYAYSAAAHFLGSGRELELSAWKTQRTGRKLPGIAAANPLGAAELDPEDLRRAELLKVHIVSRASTLSSQMPDQ